MARFIPEHGWTFERLDNGRVEIVVEDEYAVTLDAATWASVVASVTPSGDNAKTFGMAEQLHAKGDQAFPEDRMTAEAMAGADELASQ